MIPLREQSLLYWFGLGSLWFLAGVIGAWEHGRVMIFHYGNFFLALFFYSCGLITIVKRRKDKALKEKSKEQNQDRYAR